MPGILESFPRARVVSTAETREHIRTETRVGIGKPDHEQDASLRQRAEQAATQFESEAARADHAPSMRAQYAVEAQWIRQRIERQMGAYAVLPSEVIEDSLQLDDADGPVELRFFGPGNTRSDLIAWLPKQKVLATGDVVVAPTPYGFDVSARPWLAVLQRVERLPFEILVPGHGAVQRDRHYLRTLEWSMQDILARASASAADGLSKDEAFARFDPAEQRSRFRADDAWTRKWLNDYWLEGMFGTAYDEAKGVSTAAF